MEHEPQGDLGAGKSYRKLARYICVELIGDNDQIELKAVPRDEAIAAGFSHTGILSGEVDEDKLEALWNDAVDLPANWN